MIAKKLYFLARELPYFQSIFMHDHSMEDFATLHKWKRKKENPNQKLESRTDAKLWDKSKFYLQTLIYAYIYICMYIYIKQTNSGKEDEQSSRLRPRKKWPYHKKHVLREGLLINFLKHFFFTNHKSPYEQN